MFLNYCGSDWPLRRVLHSGCDSVWSRRTLSEVSLFSLNRIALNRQKRVQIGRQKAGSRAWREAK
jgi:hypothetical protein